MKAIMFLAAAALLAASPAALAQGMMSSGAMKPSGSMMSAGNMAAAPQPAMVKVMGTIDAVNGDELDVTAGDGSKQALALTDKSRISISIPITIDQIQAGSYIGAGAQGDAAGSNLKAVEITVFPESARGAGEGFRPWDQGPNSRMTNGTVSQVVNTNGRSITITYKGGQQPVAVGDGTPIVTFAVGDRTSLTPGAHISVRGTKGADGKIMANFISVGKDGSVPPQ